MSDRYSKGRWFDLDEDPEIFFRVKKRWVFYSKKKKLQKENTLGVLPNTLIA
jgi:hypothetical protein